MKDTLLAVGMTALLFAAGYLVGQNQKGRYYYHDGKVFDTRTGVIYVTGFGEGAPKFLYVHDQVRGTYSVPAFKEVQEGYYSIDYTE
jgi:hypothetical protein